MIYICLMCSKEFKAKPSDKSKYCSNACYSIARKQLDISIPERVCVMCNTKFNPQGHRQRYCKKCLTIVCLYCGKEFINKDNRADKRFCSLVCYHKSKEGIEPEQLTKNRGKKPRTYHLVKRDKHGGQFDKDWRNSIFARDKWTCQACKKQGGKLQAHHIKPYKEYPELRHDIENGITLCLGCHSKTESYGWSKYWHSKNKAKRRIETALDQTEIEL